MKKLMITSALVAVAGGAHAGGLDRSNQSILPLFDDPGTYAFSIGRVMPEVTGTDALGNDYNVGNDYTQLSASFTNAINSQFSYSVIYDQPFGADVFYDANPATSTLGGTFADISSDALTVLGRYHQSPNLSFFGGIRLQQAGGSVGLGGRAYGAAFASGGAAQTLAAGLQQAAQSPNATQAATAQAILQTPELETALRGVALANPAVPASLTAGIDAALGAGTVAATQTSTNAAIGQFVGVGSAGYTADLEDSYGVGFTLGAAYEIPEIALRAVLTYHSAIEHDADTTEVNRLTGTTTGTTTFETPQSINLEFQTGVAPDTLLTAGVRWAEWGDFDVVPPTLGSDLADIDDSWRWNVGLARRFNEQFAGSIGLTYEKDQGSTTVSPLGPNDGQVGISLGGAYTAPNGAVISGGINYTNLGNANAGVGGQAVATFEDSYAVGVGLKVSMSF
ncbi:MAG: hypothetical protein ACU0DW_07220 [Shimia sp.]